MTLTARLAKLEQRPRSLRSLWREYLAQVFAHPRYNVHRAVLIDALSSDSPTYIFAGEYEGRPATFLLSWWQREGTDPSAPLVRTYAGEWADVLPQPTEMVIVSAGSNDC